MPLFGRRSRRNSASSAYSIESSENPYEYADFEIESNLPADVTLVPSFNSEFTRKHPLGNILLQLKCQNLALYKKLNIPTSETELDELCGCFVKAIKAERDKTTTKINKTSDLVENSLLEKELNYQNVTSQIRLPQNYSPIPVLTDPAKLNETIKVFPTKHAMKFNAKIGSSSIIEFLNSMTLAQSIVNLSREEFLDTFLRCTTGKVYSLLSEYINFGYSIEDIYFSLTTLYDDRISAGDARKLISSYTIPKSSTLTKALGSIMHLASRVASQIPDGPSRVACYDLEANTTLMRALPQNSATLTRDVFNALSAKLQRSPTFVEFSKALNKFSDTITSDIQKFGSRTGYEYGENRNQTFSKNVPNAHYAHNVHNRSFRTYAVNSESIGEVTGPPKRFINQRGTGFKSRPSRFNKNPNMGLNRGGRQSFNPNPSRKKYCSLCASSTHNASDLCYKMVDNKGNVVETIPTFDHCKKCESVLGKKLYHPSSLCISRDNHPRNKNT